MADLNSIIRILIILVLIATASWIINYIIVVFVCNRSKEFFFEQFFDFLIAGISFAVLICPFLLLCKPHDKSSDEKNCYEITVNEKSFKASGFKTKTDGSIEFTADDGTIIRASEYEIRKLSGSNDISEGENK